MNLSSLKGTEVAFYKEMAIVSTFSEYYCPLHSKHSQFFMNYFITFQNYNFITKQICFVIPGLDILQSKHSQFFMNYRPYLNKDFNSQGIYFFIHVLSFFIFYASVGREQLHSLLEWLRPSIRQMSYPTFIKMHKFFFVVRNMKAKGIIQ